MSLVSLFLFLKDDPGAIGMQSLFFTFVGTEGVKLSLDENNDFSNNILKE